MDSKVVYVYHEDLIRECNRLPAVRGRASMIHKLIEAYGLLQYMKIVNSAKANYEDLMKFHSELYLNHLIKIADINEEEDYVPDEQDEQYGIGYDCPPVPNMFQLISTVAGGSITAAKSLVLGLGNIAINWYGGWHHASRSRSEGFCYVNDIVLAIETLRNKFPKVLYIDLDVHHGDGVEQCYSTDKNVFTLSFHKYEPGFFPGTGKVEDVGSLLGKGYSCNVPLHGFYSDGTIDYVFERVFSLIYGKFKPDAIVMQCGADALARDPYGGANLTEEGYWKCLKQVIDKQKPTLLLGGGGYNNANSARLWTSLAAFILGVNLDEDIPDHDYWPQYGTDYAIKVQPSLAKDLNKKCYLDECIRRIKDNMDNFTRKQKCVLDKNLDENQSEDPYEFKTE